MNNEHIVLIIAVIVVLIGAGLAFYVPDKNPMCFRENGTKSYIGLNSDVCSRIRFECIAGSEYFSDKCGCGCVLIKGEKKPAIYCTDESRNAEFCTQQYEPVCGWFDPSKVQCVDYPCAVDASNSCTACKNKDVLYYTEDICPSP